MIQYCSKNGPRGHIKFDLVFQLCCIINILFKMNFLPSMSNLISNSLQLNAKA